MRLTTLLFIVLLFSCQTIKENHLKVPTEIENLFFNYVTAWSEFNYKKGKKDGLFTIWWDNGQKHSEGTYKDGKIDGLETWYYKNGPKETETIYKNGKKDGLDIWYYENGQKKEETTFKYGKEISKKRWNEDGSVKE